MKYALKPMKSKTMAPTEIRRIQPRWVYQRPNAAKGARSQREMRAKKLPIALNKYASCGGNGRRTLGEHVLVANHISGLRRANNSGRCWLKRGITTTKVSRAGLYPRFWLVTASNWWLPRIISTPVNSVTQVSGEHHVEQQGFRRQYRTSLGAGGWLSCRGRTS